MSIIDRFLEEITSFELIAETRPRGNSKMEMNDVSETHETVDTTAAGSSHIYHC